MKIILISGKAESGKDTVANLFKNAITKAGKQCVIAKFADLLKWQCKTFYGWNGEKDEAGRTLLQETADNVKSLYGRDYYANQLVKQIEMFDDEIDYLIISDWRYEEERKAIKEAFFRDENWMMTLYIESNHKSTLTAEQQIHSSEIFLPKPYRDIIITNPRRDVIITNNCEIDDDALEGLSAKVNLLIEKYQLI